MASLVEKVASETESPPVNICASESCDKPAKMACPTCIKLGAPPTRFCDQDCFKASWAKHKELHTAIKAARAAAIAADPSSMPREFKNYMFTGNLRPWKVTEKSVVPEGIEKPDYADHPEGRSEQEERDKRNRDVIVEYNETQLEGPWCGVVWCVILCVLCVLYCAVVSVLSGVAY